MKAISYGFVLGLLLGFVTATLASDASIPHSFITGTPAKADEVNANFMAVKSAVDDNNARIGAIEGQLDSFGMRVMHNGIDLESGQLLLDAMNGITDATVDNPYMITVGPGRFDLGNATLAMKPFVSLLGMGSEILSSSPNGTIAGADGSAVHNVKVSNSGGLGISYVDVGDMAAGNVPFVTNLMVFVKGANPSVGIAMVRSALSLGTNYVVVDGESVNAVTGIALTGSFLSMTGTVISGDNAIAGTGIDADWGGTAGTESTLMMGNVAIGGSFALGVSVNNGSSAGFRNSSIKGTDNAGFMDNGSSIVVATSQLKGNAGGVYFASGPTGINTAACVHNFDNSYIAIPDNPTDC